MRRWLTVFFVAAFVVSASANDFFGIPILGKPKDDINAIIANLIKGDHKKASLHLKHLAKTTPKFAKNIKLTDFTIPCADCIPEKNPACETCEGRSKDVNQYALRYLQYKFSQGLDADLPLEKAWDEAIKAFKATHTW